MGKLVTRVRDSRKLFLGQEKGDCPARNITNRHFGSAVGALIRPSRTISRLSGQSVGSCLFTPIAENQLISTCGPMVTIALDHEQ
jgi:hypothetical protein